jgi:predicted acyl esterase
VWIIIAADRRLLELALEEEVPVHLASDYIHPTPRGGRCRIRIYLPEGEQDAPVVICSELPNNGGTSVTYAAERLAAEVIRSHTLPTPLV